MASPPDGDTSTGSRPPADQPRRDCSQEITKKVIGGGFLIGVLATPAPATASLAKGDYSAGNAGTSSDSCDSDRCASDSCRSDSCTASDRNNLAIALLTAREEEVVALLGDGFYYKEIDVRLGISQALVRKLQHNAYRKLHAQNRTEAISRWHQLRARP
jgi:DNA-binding CsgD family transcriptional regulator